MGVGVSRWRLAGSVAACGGMGTLAAQGLGQASDLPIPIDEAQARRRDDPHGVRAVVRETQAALQRADGRGIVAVNIMVAITHFEALVAAALEGGADAIVCGAGLPLKLPTLVGDRDVALIPMVSSARALRSLCRYWTTFSDGRLPDAVVVEGPKAGGHLGFSEAQIDDPAFQLEALVPEVVAEAARWGDIPVIAAGGVWDHQDAWTLFDLGARAVQLGTRFVITEECDVDPGFKQRYLACGPDDITLTRTPVGLLGRVIRGPLLAAFERGEFPGFKCHYRCISSCVAHEVRYCIADHLLDAARGDEMGFYFVGTNGWRCRDLLPVAELMRRLAEGEAAR